MVWAPEAIWDDEKGQYMVYWASKFYSSSDARHTGSPSNTRIRYAYTSDFRTFSAPQTYIDKSPADIIDLTILPFPGGGDSDDDNITTSYLRFMKDETRKNVFLEFSTTGLFGIWTRPGGATAYIESNVEGPAAYIDNSVASMTVHLLLDFYNNDGYRPYQRTISDAITATNTGWTASSRAGFPSGLRHGSVLPLNESLYSELRAKWG
ncbi:hypothetical protein VTK73DRAFT_5394 [Phialemonium thermophilum]|uniref:Uncharacterized protein n=1 Tax=Phialemonium thermophilum TaxID=223376 RepID=A0ABR3XXY0_9PEZI